MENVEEVLIMSDSGYPTSDQSEGRRGSAGSGGSGGGGHHGSVTSRTYSSARSTTRPSYYRWYTGADGKLKYGGNGYPNVVNGGGGNFMQLEPQNQHYVEKYSARQATATTMSASSVHVQHLPYGYGGFNPAKNVVEQEALSQEEERKQSQIQAYVIWVNAQLKKKPGTRPIEDLASDMHDGVALIDLIEVVSGEKLTCVYESPATRAEKVTNIDSVLQFMTRRRIRMHQTTATDIVSGNVKAVMRLVLALAAHFKPNSVKATTGYQPRQNMAVLAQGAAVALANARQHAESTPGRSGSPYVQSPAAVRRQRDREATDKHVESKGSSRPAHNEPSMQVPAVPRSVSFDTGRALEDKAIQIGLVSVGESIEEAPCNCNHDDAAITAELAQTREALLTLQALLLNGQLPSETGDYSVPSVAMTSSSAEDEVVVLRSQLQQLTHASDQLRDDVTRLRADNLQLTGAKAGLQQRLSEQESTSLQSQADLLRVSMAHKTAEANRVEFETKITECDGIIANLQKALVAQVQQNEELRAALHACQQNNASSANALKSQVADLHARVHGVNKAEVALTSSIAGQGRRLAKLEEDILQSQLDINTRPRSFSGQGRDLEPEAANDDLRLVRESLHSLHSCVPGTMPHQHAIDTLERGISALLDRLEVSERQASRLGRGSAAERDASTSDLRNGHSDASLNLHNASNPNNDTVVGSRRSSSRLDEQHSRNNGGSLNNSLSSTADSGMSTKVLYFTEKTVAPFACSVPKRFNEVTLRDFKNVIDRPGKYRYHFKANDPEFGTVKEEVIEEDQVVPHWEGKIVAWLEEDHNAA